MSVIVYVNIFECQRAYYEGVQIKYKIKFKLSKQFIDCKSLQMTTIIIQTF